MSAGRRTLRERKVAQRIAVVDEHTRKKAAQERLDAYEADNEAGDDARGPAGSDDDDFVIAGDEDEEDEEVEISGKRKKKRPPSGAPTATKRKLRTGGAVAQRVPKTFGRLLEEAGLDRVPPGTPTYFTAQAGPPQASAPRKFCSVCGNMSSYKCARCGSLYCSRRCLTTHSETRCLKLIT